MGEGGERAVDRVRRGTGGDEWKDQGGGETGFAGMRGGGYAGGVCGESEIRWADARKCGEEFVALRKIGFLTI